MLNHILLGKKYITRTETFQVVCTCRPVLETARRSHCRCSMRKVFLIISQNSQENACVRVLLLRLSFLTVFIRLQALIWKIREVCNFIKKAVFLSVLRNFLEDLFYRTPQGSTFSTNQLTRSQSFTQYSSNIASFLVIIRFYCFTIEP